jgi:hypothetical protein
MATPSRTECFAGIADTSCDSDDLLVDMNHSSLAATVMLRISVSMVTLPTLIAPGIAITGIKTPQRMLKSATSMW